MLSFSDLRIEFSGIDPSPAAAKNYLKSTITQTLELFDRSVNRWMLLPQERPVAAGVLGRWGSPPTRLASDLRLRLLLGSQLIDLFEAMQAEQPQRRFFLVTLISDRWLSFDRRTTIWLRGMKRAIHQVIRLGGFDGWLGLLEIQTLDATVSAFGRILLPHGHFIAWSDNPDFSPANAVRKMARSGRLESAAGVPTVDVSAIPGTSPCNLAAYVFKSACTSKYRVPSPLSPSGFVLAECKLPPVSAVRQLEVLSNMYFDELLLSGGDGQALRDKLLSTIRRSSEDDRRELDVSRARRFWKAARRRTGNVIYEAVDVDRSGAQLPPKSPISLALEHRPGSEWMMNWLRTTHPGASLCFVERITHCADMINGLAQHRLVAPSPG